MKTLLKQALEFTEFCWRDVTLNEYGEELRSKLEDALRAELAKPDPEPVGWARKDHLSQVRRGAFMVAVHKDRDLDDLVPLYAAPVNCKWPTCHSQQYQQALATDVADRIIGKPEKTISLPQGYGLHEISAGYTGKLWIEGQMNRYGQACYEEGLTNVETINEMTGVADRYAHVIAMWLELVCSDYSGEFYDSALQALGEYRSDMNRIHERESPTFMGEPVMPKNRNSNCSRHPDAPHGDDNGKCQCQSWAPGEAS